MAQEFEQLMPWKTIVSECFVSDESDEEICRKRTSARANALIKKVGLTKFRDIYPHNVVRWHGNSGRDRTRDGDGAGYSPDG